MSADDIAKAEHSRHAKKISDREQAKRTAEMKDKLEERKAQRLVEKQLKNTKALGAVVNESDDDLLVRCFHYTPDASESTLFVHFCSLQRRCCCWLHSATAHTPRSSRGLLHVSSCSFHAHLPRA